MKFSTYLEENQQMVYKTFFNALTNDKLAHAYLIKGNEGAPLLECAKFLAKSLICQEDIFACEECLTCIRFDEGNFADFRLLDGSKNNIKVSDIEQLQSFFNSTPVEKSKKMIYIIHLLENSNRESLNAILKFLEEPQANVYAFITTYNEEKLLPTILSRVQHLKLLPLDTSVIIAKLQDEGVSTDDAEILTNFYTNIDTILEIVSNQNYIQIKDLVFELLDEYNVSKTKMLYFMETSIIPLVKDKVSLRLFLDLLSLAFKDILNHSLNLGITLKTQNQIISNLSKKINDPSKIYLELMLLRGQIDLNVNTGLMLERAAIILHEGGK